MADCIELARAFGATIADRHELPVFLYAEAASTPARRALADVRRPGYEGLESSIATPAGTPDFGPSRPHPTAGATVVGARPVLIAWNIQLGTEDVAVARRIAARIRERDGGLPRRAGAGPLPRGRASGAGLDEPSRPCDHAALAGLGAGRRARVGRGRRGGRLGADRARAARGPRIGGGPCRDPRVGHGRRGDRGGELAEDQGLRSGPRDRDDDCASCRRRLDRSVPTCGRAAPARRPPSPAARSRSTR